MDPQQTAGPSCSGTAGHSTTCSAQHHHPSTAADAAVNPCLGLACSYHYYRGPYGRHIAIVNHVGQGCLLLGGLLMVLAYTVLRDAPDIHVQWVFGMLFFQFGLTSILAGFTTYMRAQHSKVGGGVSPLWSKDTLVALYTRMGFMNIFVGFGVSMVGFNLHEDWALPFRVAGPVGLAVGTCMLMGARVYTRTPCYRRPPSTGVCPSGCPTQWAHHSHQQPPPQQCSCPARRARHASSLRPGEHDAAFAGPVVVLPSSGGRELSPDFPPHPVNPVLPPVYESLSPPLDLPPSYIMVSPTSPPPSYSEACDVPKDEDGNPRDLHLGPPPAYSSSYDHPTPSGYPA